MARDVVSRPALERDAIVRRALAVADVEGLDSVSFRRLAADFGVTPMALYRHVRDKTDLIDAMADLVLADVRAPSRTKTGWMGELRALLRSVHRVLDAHPAGAALLTLASGTAPHALRLTEIVLDILTRAGFAAGDSMAIVQQLTTVVVGPRLLYAGGWADTARSREFGLDLFLAGLEALLARGRGGAGGRRSRPAGAR